MRRRSRHTPWLSATSVLCAVLLGGYIAVAAQVELPVPEVAIHDAFTTPLTVSGESAERVVAAQSLPTAIGFAHHDDVWANDFDAHPLASVSKLVTMLVCLEAQPLPPDTTSWPTHTWSLEDRKRQDAYLADLGVVYPIPVGTEIPLADMFTLIFLPSANDMVAAYAYSVFDSNDAFIDAVHDWAERHGLESLEFVEPSGMNEGNVASVGDVLRLGRMALEHPVMSQFISLPAAHVPGIGVVENTNPLLGVEPGIVGVKTGRSASAGFNLVVAQTRDLGERRYTQIAVTMGRGSLEERASSGREMLAHLDTLAVDIAAMTAGDEVGTITDWRDEIFPIVTKSGTNITLLPGEQAERSIEMLPRLSGVPGDRVGNVTIAAPDSEHVVELTSEYAPHEPGLWWRVTHPSLVFR